MNSTINLGFEPDDTILVTGAAHGIGRAVAAHAAEIGLAVSAWDIDAEGLDALADEVRAAGGRIHLHVGNALDASVIREGVAGARTALGQISHVVHTASPSSTSPLTFDEAVTTCIGGVRQLTEEWLASGAPKHASTVVIVSVAGTHFATANPWYSAAKAGLAGYVRHLAGFRADEVRPNAIAPGLVDTPRLADFAKSELGRQIVSRNPLGRLGTPDELAWATLFLLSPLASYINGTVLTVDGGWTLAQ